MASLINAQLVAMGKDDVKWHIFQYLHSVFSSRNEGLLSHTWYAVSLAVIWFWVLNVWLCC